MAMQSATLKQLQDALKEVIARTQADRPTTAAIFQLMYNTGLRVNEVLEVERWQSTDYDTFIVQLEKREGTREIAILQVPDAISDRYAYGQRFELETYSAVNNTFKYYAPGLIFGGDTRRTTCHAFRYQYMKQLAADGQTTAQVAATMGHVNLANTARYIQDEIWLGS